MTIPLAQPERPDLDALLAEWAPVMGLADWDIKIKYERHLTCRGNVSYGFRKREAVIRIQDPLDYPEGDLWGPDPERTVVHELAHLHFAIYDFKLDTPEDIAEDQAVDAFAKALVNTKRRFLRP